MKTKEFLEKIQTIDFDVPEQIEINYKKRFVRITEEGFNVFIELDDLYYRIQVFYKPVPKELLELIFEYVNTPVEEREEEKRYKLKLKGIKDNVGYLNVDTVDKSFRISTSAVTTSFNTIFTQTEIDNLPDEIKKHNWEYIEVDEC